MRSYGKEKTGTTTSIEEGTWQDYFLSMELATGLVESYVDGVRQQSDNAELFLRRCDGFKYLVFANGALTSFPGLLGYDWYGFGNYYDMNIKSHNSANALCFTMKQGGLPGGSFDRDVVYRNAPKRDTDWTGATDLIVAIDGSNLTQPFRFRVAFEEQVVGHQSFDLKDGAAVTYYTMEGVATATTADSVEAGDAEQGRCGWVVGLPVAKPSSGGRGAEELMLLNCGVGEDS